MALTGTVAPGGTILTAWGNEVRDRTVQIFSTKAELDTWTTAPDGAHAVTTTEKVEWVRSGGAWTPIGCGYGNPPYYSLRVWRNGAHGVTGGQWNVVYFDSEAWDPSNSYTEATRFTAPIAGVWAWSVAVALTAPGAVNPRVFLAEFRNGSEFQRVYDQPNIPASTEVTLSGSATETFAAGDTFDIRVFTSVTTNIANAQHRTFLSMWRL
jgi:hypothetical protein